MSNKKNNERNIVDDHRNMLMVSKNISSFQEENLKRWVFLFLQDVDKVNVHWNFIKDNENKEFYAGKVLFDIELKKDHHNTEKDLEQAKEQLEVCTKFIFWKETRVNVKIRDER